jgi:hypothetical protein
MGKSPVTEFTTISLGFTGHVLDRNYRGPAKSDTLLASLTNPAYHYHFKHPRGYEQRFDQLDQIGDKLVDARLELHRHHHAYPRTVTLPV